MQFKRPSCKKTLTLVLMGGGGWLNPGFLKIAFTKKPSPRHFDTPVNSWFWLYFIVQKNPKEFVKKKFYYITETKWTSLSWRPIQNVTSNDRGIGNAQLLRIKKIIMGI